MKIQYKLAKPIISDAQTFIRDSLESSFNILSLEFLEKEIQLAVDDNIESAELETVLKKLIYISSSIGKNRLYENIVNTSCVDDPMPYLKERGDVKKISRGIFMFQGQYLKLFKVANSYLKNIAINKCEAVEQEYPTLWPLDLFRKLNYFKEFPHQAILTTTVKEDYNELKKFAEKYNNVNEYDRVNVKEHMDDAYYGLEPAVCNTCYYALSNKKNHDNTVYTTYNKVFRNESSDVDSLDRLMNFSVRDIMFVGDEEFVLTTRQRLIDELSEFINFFEIDCIIESANDPFFSGDVARKLFQYSFGLKYELLANIPYLNKRIAIGSINLHLDTFGQVFDIRSVDGNRVSSGCIGVGFERLVFAMFSQHGCDLSAWPESLKKNLSSIGVTI